MRTGKWFYFSAVNPCMYNGGFFANTKTEMYHLLPKDSYPAYQLIKPNTDIQQLSITYPCIVKPSIGERGFGIKKIHHFEELRKYHEWAKFEYLIQDFCDYKNELSVFCIRDITTNKFYCSSIIGKTLLSVRGDGIHTIYELIVRNPRAYLQLDRLKDRWGNTLHTILKNGEEFILIDNANHSKGAIFFHIEDPSNKIGQLFIHISETIIGFNYGRYDIKYNSIEELIAGKYSIIELNGVGAEPIDMYIPNLPLWKGLSILIYHWKKMFEIANYNIYQLHYRTLTKKEGFTILQAHKKYKGNDLW